MKKMLDSTPRKKFLFQKYKKCAKRVSYLQEKHKSLQRVSSLFKRESDAIVNLIFSNTPDGSRKVLSSLLWNCNIPRNARRWNMQEKLLFLSVYKRSPRTYQYLSSLLAVPSISTLKGILQSIPFLPGINPFLFKHLGRRVQRMDDRDKYCVVLFDEMSIKPFLIYNSRLDVIEGFQDHGSSGRKDLIASEALVFMIRGLRQKWKQPIAYYFSCGATPGPIIAKLIVEVVTAVKDAGLNVAATVCDMGSNNTSALRTLGSTPNHPYISLAGGKIFTCYDPPHLLKCTRNMFLKYCIEGKVSIGGEELYATGKWQHIEEVILLSRRYCRNVTAFPKITAACLNPKWKQKMNVSLAAQIFNHTLASQMDLFVGLESTNSRVLYFSIFSVCCLLGLATWQGLYLRRFFKAKKLIE